MDKFSREQLEHKLSLQQLQINRLLEITQAINNNLKIEDLYNIYKHTLLWEMRIKKFVFYTMQEDKWKAVIHNGIDENLIAEPIEDYLSKYQRAVKIEEKEHKLLSELSYVIPVYHKKYPIAFTFIGENQAEMEEDVYEPIRFVSAISNIIAVAIENKRLFKKQLEQERLKRDLELAVQVQNMLIPKDLPSNNQFEFSGIYHPHDSVGGDYYDFLELNDKELAFCIADISGKGISAALIMSNFQATLQLLINRKTLSVIEFADLLNQKVIKTTKGERFITFFLARYHKTKKRLRYLNAGHNAPIMISGGKVQRLDKGCILLGAFHKIPKIEMGEIYLDDDAFFLLYTDGLTDLRNHEGDYFDDEKVIEFASANNHLPVKNFNEKLLETVNSFRGDEQFPDDISFLSGRIFIDNCKN